MTADPATLDAMLAAILASPNDDLPRLVLADALDDVGQHERAELIRIQCEVSRLETTLATPFEDQDLCEGISASWCPVCGDCCCESPEDSMNDQDCPLHSPTSRHAGDDSLKAKLGRLKEREAALLTDANWLNWAGDLPAIAGYAWPNMDGPFHWEFRRGFVAVVECRLEEWMRHGPEISRQHPVLTVTATDATLDPYLLADHSVSLWTNLPPEINALYPSGRPGEVATDPYDWTRVGADADDAAEQARDALSVALIQYARST